MPIDIRRFQPGQTLDLNDLEVAVPGRYPDEDDLTGQRLVERLLGTGQNSVVLAVDIRA